MFTQAPLNYGFIDYNGNAWSNSSVDTYNRFNEQVVKREKKLPLPANSLAFKELEFYRDQRHKTFTLLCDIAKEKALT